MMTAKHRRADKGAANETSEPAQERKKPNAAVRECHYESGYMEVCHGRLLSQEYLPPSEDAAFVTDRIEEEQGMKNNNK
jgi:hypothetical protein